MCFVCDLVLFLSDVNIIRYEDFYVDYSDVNIIRYEDFYVD
jgi:hypothetical protein